MNMYLCAYDISQTVSVCVCLCLYTYVRTYIRMCTCWHASWKPTDLAHKSGWQHLRCPRDCEANPRGTHTVCRRHCTGKSKKLQISVKWYVRTYAMLHKHRKHLTCWHISWLRAQTNECLLVATYNRSSLDMYVWLHMNSFWKYTFIGILTWYVRKHTSTQTVCPLQP